MTAGEGKLDLQKRQWVTPLFPTPALIRPAKPSNADLTAVPKAHQQGSDLSNVEPKLSDQTTGVLDLSRLSQIRD